MVLLSAHFVLTLGAAREARPFRRIVHGRCIAAPHDILHLSHYGTTTTIQKDSFITSTDHLHLYTIHRNDMHALDKTFTSRQVGPNRGSTPAEPPSPDSINSQALQIGPTRMPSR
jgi:hypothetical protein